MITREQLVLQKEVLNHFWKEVNTKPHFINNTKFDDIVIREQMQDVWKELSLLLDSRFLTEKAIINIYEFSYETLVQVMATDVTIGVMYCRYIEDLLNYYKEWCEDIELYESTSNINKFLNIWEDIE